MKKILFIFILVLVYSCEETSNTHLDYNIKKIENVDRHQNTPFDKVYEWTYKGHEYIGFDGYRRLGIVHNPDCKKCNL